MKKKRQEKILDLITSLEIETQEDLAECLRKEGFDVTQATVSRDIRELHLTKMAGSSGRQKYVQAPSDNSTLNEKYLRVLKEGMLSADVAGNILVIHTVTGMAMAAATALDALHFPEILGCIAGDDTIFCAIRTIEDAENLKEKLRGLN